MIDQTVILGLQEISHCVLMLFECMFLHISSTIHARTELQHCSFNGDNRQIEFLYEELLSLMHRGNLSQLYDRPLPSGDAPPL